MNKIIFIVLCLLSLCSVGQEYVWDSAVFAESHNNTMPVYRMELTQADEKVVLGYYRDSLNIANQSLYSSKNYGVFLAKYNAQDELLWAKTIAERNNLVSGNTPSIQIDVEGNTYVGLTYIDTLFVDDIPFSVSEDYLYCTDFSILKVDVLGNLITHVKLNGTCSKVLGSNGVQVDENQNIYLSGHFGNASNSGSPSCSCIFGVESFDVEGSSSFLTKINSNNQVVWAKPLGASSNNIKLIDYTIYVVGESSSSSISFGDYTLNFPSFYDEAGYIAKFDTSGVFHWAKHFGVTAWDSHLQILDVNIIDDNNIAVVGSSYTQSVSNNVYIQGSSTLYGNEWGSDDAFIISYDSLGSVQWQDITGGSGQEWFIESAIDSDKNLFITGIFTSSFAFGENTLTSLGGEDVLMVAYDSLGNHLLAKNIGGTSLDQGHSIAIDSNDNLFITGATSSQQFNLDNIAYEIDNSFIQMFLAKLKLSGIGVHELDLANTIELYPNPNAGAFSISSEQNLEQLEIYNLLGEKVFEKYFEKPTKQFHIESSLITGVYFVLIKTEEGNYTAQKMIVE